MRSRVVSIGFALSLFVIPLRVSAHLSGQSLEQQVGDYLVDIGYDAYRLQPGQETIFSFALIENAGSWEWDFADFDEVRVRFARGDETLHEETLTIDTAVTPMLTYTFPSAGEDYSLTARYLNDGTDVATASFPLTVGGRFTLPLTPSTIAMFVFPLFSLFLALALWRRSPDPE